MEPTFNVVQNILMDEKLNIEVISQCRNIISLLSDKNAKNAQQLADVSKQLDKLSISDINRTKSDDINERFEKLLHRYVEDYSSVPSAVASMIRYHTWTEDYKEQVLNKEISELKKYDEQISELKKYDEQISQQDEVYTEFCLGEMRVKGKKRIHVPVEPEYPKTNEDNFCLNMEDKLSKNDPHPLIDAACQAVDKQGNPHSPQMSEDPAQEPATDAAEVASDALKKVNINNEFEVNDDDITYDSICLKEIQDALDKNILV